MNNLGNMAALQAALLTKPAPAKRRSAIAKFHAAARHACVLARRTARALTANRNHDPVVMWGVCVALSVASSLYAAGVLR